MEPTFSQIDVELMKFALKEAYIALENDEVPVGAILISKDKIISNGHNLTETLIDVTAHAEMQVIKEASSILKTKYLKECTLYITLEPCIMCAGALFWTKISRVVFGGYDKKQGFLKFGIKLHPKTIITSGILEFECYTLLKNFFKIKRDNKKLNSLIR